MTLAVQKSVPRLVITLGMFGSASTWVYSVVSLLLQHHAGGQDRVFISYADSPDFLGRNVANILSARFSVLKTHQPAPELAACTHLAAAPVFMSLRDPRDCVVSMMQRFDWTFDEASEKVLGSCNAVLEWSTRFECSLLRYEDAFTTNSETITHIASSLRLPNQNARDQKIHSDLAAATLREAIDARDSGIATEHPALASKRSAWHKGHVGNGEIGKFKDHLSTAQITQIERRAWRMMRKFGYICHDDIDVESGKTLKFGAKDFGFHYLGDGFRTADRGGIWTERASGTLALPLKQQTRAVRLEFDLLWTAADTSASRENFTIWVNDAAYTLIGAGQKLIDKQPFSVVLEVFLPQPTDLLSLYITFNDTSALISKNAAQTADYNWAANKQRLGILALRCHY
jgi:hypothetical protein